MKKIFILCALSITLAHAVESASQANNPLLQLLEAIDAPGITFRERTERAMAFAGRAAAEMELEVQHQVNANRVRDSIGTRMDRYRTLPTSSRISPDGKAELTKLQEEIHQGIVESSRRNERMASIQRLHEIFTVRIWPSLAAQAEELSHGKTH